jgi:hypothetical protein
MVTIRSAEEIAARDAAESAVLPSPRIDLAPPAPAGRARRVRGLSPDSRAAPSAPTSSAALSLAGIDLAAAAHLPDAPASAPTHAPEIDFRAPAAATDWREAEQPASEPRSPAAPAPDADAPRADDSSPLAPGGARGAVFDSDSERLSMPGAGSFNATLSRTASPLSARGGVLEEVAEAGGDAEARSLDEEARSLGEEARSPDASPEPEPEPEPEPARAEERPAEDDTPAPAPARDAPAERGGCLPSAEEAAAPADSQRGAAEEPAARPAAAGALDVSVRSRPHPRRARVARGAARASLPPS